MGLQNIAPLLVEISRKKTSLSNKELIELVIMHLESIEKPGKNIVIDCKDVDFLELNHHVEEIIISGALTLPLDLDKMKFNVFSYNEQGAEIETIENGGEDIQSSNHWILPCKEFRGLYESLLYEPGLKESLLKYIETTMLFAKKSIDTNFISCNRMVLLHGPPGTGKTSLCKALAQKVSIQMQNHYKYTHLIEINSHSLFSKWFSESGKLVMKLFDKIKELVQHKESLVCVLIDEVESIVFARNAVGSHEPSDSLRVVNAVLTQLDQIRNYPNVLVLTTSNLTSTIDLAFVDRADIKQFIGNPTAPAIYEIFSLACNELAKCGLIAPNNFKLHSISEIDSTKCEYDHSANLLNIATKSVGLSGRSLKKIPFLAFALFVQSDTVTIAEYLIALVAAVSKYLADELKMKK